MKKKVINLMYGDDTVSRSTDLHHYMDVFEFEPYIRRLMHQYFRDVPYEFRKDILHDVFVRVLSRQKDFNLTFLYYQLKTVVTTFRRREYNVLELKPDVSVLMDTSFEYYILIDAVRQHLEGIDLVMFNEMLKNDRDEPVWMELGMCRSSFYQHKASLREKVYQILNKVT